jgi:hypothetical protein
LAMSVWGVQPYKQHAMQASHPAMRPIEPMSTALLQPGRLVTETTPKWGLRPMSLPAVDIRSFCPNLSVTGQLVVECDDYNYRESLGFLFTQKHLIFLQKSHTLCSFKRMSSALFFSGNFDIFHGTEPQRKGLIRRTRGRIASHNRLATKEARTRISPTGCG